MEAARKHNFISTCSHVKLALIDIFELHLRFIPTRLLGSFNLLIVVCRSAWVGGGDQDDKGWMNHTFTRTLSSAEKRGQKCLVWKLLTPRTTTAGDYLVIAMEPGIDILLYSSLVLVKRWVYTIPRNHHFALLQQRAWITAKLDNSAQMEYRSRAFERFHDYVVKQWWSWRRNIGSEQDY